MNLFAFSIHTCGADISRLKSHRLALICSSPSRKLSRVCFSSAWVCCLSCSYRAFAAANKNKYHSKTLYHRVQNKNKLGSTLQNYLLIQYTYFDKVATT